MPLYQYQPLAEDDIRLLSLLPGNESAPVACSLSTYPLASAPRYESVSYAWGASGGFSESLDVVESDGGGHSGTVAITPAVAVLLRALRRRSPSEEEKEGSPPRVLWVDGVCIDQGNLGERAAQVRLMRRVYDRAERVVVWLGEASGDGSSDRALAFVKRMGAFKKYRDRGHWIGGVRLGSDTSSECGAGRDDEEEVDEDGAAGPAEAPEGMDDSEDEGTEEAVEAEDREHDDEHGVANPGRSRRSSSTEDESGEDDDRKISQHLGQRAWLQFLHVLERAKAWLKGLFTQLRWKFDRLRNGRSEARRWQRLEEEWKRNSKRSHIQTGFPVLYETDLYHFFEDRFQKDWEDLDELLERPWWYRTWVVQEVWSAGDRAILQCGQTVIKWKTFQKAMDYEEAWDEMGDQIQRSSRAPLWMALKQRYGLAIHLSKRRLLNSPLSDLLWNTWDREASDPRDKIFAMLGLVGSEHQAPTQPDYTKSMVEVYKETAADIIRSENSLDILLAAGSYSSNARSGLPSWVPDWRTEANASRPTLFVNRTRFSTLYFTGSMDAVILNGHGYSACGSEVPGIKFGLNLDLLFSKALFVDEVEFLGSPQPLHGTHSGAVRADAWAVGKAAFGEGWRPATVGARKGSNRDKEDDEVRLVLSAGSPGNKSFDEVIENTMPLRRFFITKTKKHMCIGPAATQRGDKIFILAGCNFPLVLREAPRDMGSERVFDLIGEAYVHGIMAGEVILNLRKPPWWSISAWRGARREITWEEICIR